MSANPSLQFLPTFPSSILHQPFFNSLQVHTDIPTFSTKNYFPYLSLSADSSCVEGPISKSIGRSDTGLVSPYFSKAWIGKECSESLITQTKKIGVQVANSDDDNRNQNNKSIKPSSTPST